MKLKNILSLILCVSACAVAADLDTVRVSDGNVLQELYTVKKGTQIREGNFVSYYPNGRVGVEAEYKNGKLEGVYRSFYGNGSPWQEIHYANGEEHGESKTFYENGKLKSLDVYALGLLDGVSKIGRAHV